MKNKNSRSHVSCFTEGISGNEALEKWLAFNQSLEQSDWMSKMTIRQSSVDEHRALADWLGQLPSLHLSLNYIRLGSFIAAVLGALGMAGALNYSGEQPVNVWLLFAVFAIIPFLMTLLTVVSAVFSKSTSLRSSGIFVEFVAKRLRLEPLKTSSTSASVVQWLKWKLQLLSLSFIAGGLFSFLWLATFQDFTFGWSSTLIRDVQTMSQAFNFFSAPWFWLFPQPSAELVALSQFFRGQDIVSAAQLTQWWQVIVLSIIFYGLLPRLLVMLWFRSRFNATLANEIETSAALIRFFAAYRHQKTERPLSIALSADGIPPWRGQLDQTLVIGWQRRPLGYDVDFVLGQQDWDDDNRWLQEVAIEPKQSALVWVQDEQTPTGELADCLHQLQTKGSVALGVSCILDATRSANALDSWRAFAQRENIALVHMPEQKR